MGGQESKIQQPLEVNVEPKENPVNETIPSTPILTPLDPRSPSANIARTPLELILKSNLEEFDENQLQKQSETATQFILGVDPRSPTVEFERTPIIVGTLTKQLKNVDKALITTTPLTCNKKPSHIVPPKLLESSPISATSVVNKRKSFVGLLETNVDFTETNLDEVSSLKASLNKSVQDKLTHDCVTPTSDQCEPVTALTEADVQCFDNLNLSSKEKCEIETPSENEVNSVDKVDVPAPSKVSEEQVVNITVHVNDFDKKLTNLIYQDDSEEDEKVTLKFAKIKDNNRTPLAVRNSNGQNRKSHNKLKVSDKPRKSDVSKIPILKDYHGKKIGVQCENTPPKSMNEDRIRLKSKISQWDAEKTLII